MSNMNNATTWLLSVFESDLSPTQKVICCYLRTHMNDYRDMAWPSVGRIADRCSLGERAVQINLRQICDAGYLLQNGISDRGTYRYAVSTPALDAPRTKCTPPHINTDTPAPDAPELTKELTNKPPLTPPRGKKGKSKNSRRTTLQEDLTDTSWAN